MQYCNFMLGSSLYLPSLLTLLYNVPEHRVLENKTKAISSLPHYPPQDFRLIHTLLQATKTPWFAGIICPVFSHILRPVVRGYLVAKQAYHDFLCRI